MLPNNAILTTPHIASAIYGGTGAPRQRHIFMVRFKPGDTATVWGSTSAKALTFVVKHCDRPKITMKTEELSQYNKKRQIYTGHKLEPVKMTFYDSADGAAQNMWTAYARYYSGDFDPGAVSSSGGAGAYGYDVISPNYLSGAGFGINQSYGGNTTDPAAEWFFSSIEIFQFYEFGNRRSFDKYVMYNPRITSYDPDELDYENSSVAQINMTFVYEDLQYTTNQPFDGNIFPEMVSERFAGQHVDVPTTVLSSVASSSINVSTTPNNTAISSLLRIVSPNPTTTGPSVASTGSLNAQGNYSYAGVNAPVPSPAFVAALQAAPSTGSGTAQYGVNLTPGGTNSIDPTGYLGSILNSPFVTVAGMPPLY